jgi:hypothetical protein
VGIVSRSQSGGGGAQVLAASSPVTVSSAEILALDTVPKQLVAAAGAGTVQVPLGAALRYKATATPYVTGGAFLFIATAANSTLTDPVFQAISTGLLDQTADAFGANSVAGAAGAGAPLTQFANSPLVLTSNGPLTGGTGTLVCVVYYVTLVLT